MNGLNITIENIIFAIYFTSFLFLIYGIILIFEVAILLKKNKTVNMDKFEILMIQLAVGFVSCIIIGTLLVIAFQ